MDDLRERLDAVERALTDGDGDLNALAEGAAAAERVEQLEDDVADVRSDLRELQAATQALRGYVGNVRSVNERVEQRAETALAKVESLETERRTGRDEADGDRASLGNDTGVQELGDHSRGEPSHDATQDPRRQSHTCQACGQPTESDGASSADRDADGQSPTTEQPASTSAGAPATEESYDRPSLDGFDPDPDPDVPDPAEALDEPDDLQSNGDGDPALDGSVVSKIRDLV